MFNISEKFITVIGSKRSALASTKLVLEMGGIPRISEFTEKDSLEPSAKKLIEERDIECEFGGHTEEFIKKSDLVVISPGVRIDTDVVQYAHKNNIPVLGEIEFAYQFCDKPVIAVTGSNGKTTVSTLIHDVIEHSGKKAVLCGNVGKPFSQFVENLSEIDFVVLEVSSFQMESLIVPEENNRQNKFVFKGFKPFIAVLLNFSENHLDRHKDLEEYFGAKTRIFVNQQANDFAVLNARNERLRALAGTINPKVCFFNEKDSSAEEGLNPNQKAVCRVADILSISRKDCDDVFAQFPGVEHRLEFVRTLNGVSFINDSKATTAEAGRWALESMQHPVIMICGGSNKNIDYSPLKEIVSKKVKQMIVFGETRDKLRSTFSDVVSVEYCDQLKSAVEKARECATEGDSVVLSPMCASFDQFSDYEERGRVFKDIVRELGE